MLGNFVKETTSTTGTGTVTLSAVTGFSRISDQFAVGRLVAYAIEDGINRESGLGTVASGNTLERTVILSKLDGGTYSEYPAAGLNLSGSATVFITPDKGNLFHGFPGVIADLELYSSHNIVSGAPNRALAPSLDEYITLQPFLLLGRMRVDALSAYCSVGAAATVRLGLYACGSDGYPDARIAQTADIDASSTGSKVGAITPVTIPPGWYYTALASKGNAYPSFYAWATTQNRHYTPLGLAVRSVTKSIPGWTDLPAQITSPGTMGNANGDFAIALVGA